MNTLHFIQTAITRAHSKRDKSITEAQKIDYRGFGILTKTFISLQNSKKGKERS
jgi:hypothetical protein